MSGEDKHMFIESGKECGKQSDPEQFGCPSDIMAAKVYGESETPYTSGTREHSSRYHLAALASGNEQT